MANVQLEKELTESIAYFEQVLAVLPGDRMALEFLCLACLRVGENEKFLEYAMALSEVVLRERDAAGAASLFDLLKASPDPRAQAACLKLQVLLGPEPVLEPEKPELRETSALPDVAARAELALLERLVEEGVLAKGPVQPAFDFLEAIGAAAPDAAPSLVSALLILEKEHLTGAADAVAAVADAAHAPPVPLEQFELVPADVRALPERLVKVRGAVPFARLAGDWAVALLNPLDAVLRTEIETALKAKVHFFTAPPATIERVLERVFSPREGRAPSRPAGEG